ncbi:MAG: hypothetical protein KGJ55_00770 [Gammaproteobacteria bacterium]|nr:hypothetical protein [Gammaproteobacteria bacterium]
MPNPRYSRLRPLLAWILIAAPALAPAAPLPFSGVLWPYYSYQVQLPSGSPDHFSGSGAGIGGRLNLPFGLFADASYQWNNEFVAPAGGFAGSHLDQREARAGGGVNFFVPFSPLSLYGRIDYVHFGQTVRSGGVDLGHSNDDGTGYFGGVRFDGFGFALYGEGGYVNLSDADGPEARAGLELPLGRQLRMFAEYRYDDFRFGDGSGQRLRFNEARVGVRLPFGL